MIHEIGIKSGGLDLFRVQISGELVNQCAHHFKVAQFFCAQTLEMITPPY